KFQNELVEEESHGTHHREAAAELRRRKDDAASVDSKPGAGSNGGLCYGRCARSRGRGRQIRSQNNVPQPCWLSGGRLSQEPRLVCGSIRDESRAGRREKGQSRSWRIAADFSQPAVAKYANHRPHLLYGCRLGQGQER